MLVVHMRSELRGVRSPQFDVVSGLCRQHLPDNEHARPVLKEFSDQASLHTEIHRLPIFWLPDAPPADIPESDWKMLRVQAKALDDSVRSYCGIEKIFPKGATARCGCLASAYRDEDAGCVVQLYVSEDIALLLLFPVYRFNGRTVDVRTPSVPSRGLERNVHEPFGSGHGVEFRALGAPSGWSIATTIIDSVAFGLGAAGPEGMIVGAILSGIVHLLSSIIASANAQPLTLDRIETVVNDIADRQTIENALARIKVESETYLANMNAAIHEAGGTYAGTNWNAAYREYYLTHCFPDHEPFKSTIQLADKVKDLARIPDPTSAQLDNFRVAAFGWVMGAAICSRLLLDLHYFDLAVISLGLDNLETAMTNDPFELDEGDKIEMLRTQTVWLREYLKPFIENHCIKIFDSISQGIPSVDFWWTVRKAKIWYCHGSTGTGSFETFVDDGDDRFGDDRRSQKVRAAERDVQTVGMRGGPCVVECVVPPSLKSEFDKFLGVARGRFLRKIYGDTYQNDDLWHAYQKWKSILAEIEDIRTILKADIDDRVAAWKKKWEERHKTKVPRNALPKGARFVRG